jgi:hypothetical protein
LGSFKPIVAGDRMQSQQRYHTRWPYNESCERRVSAEVTQNVSFSSYPIPRVVSQFASSALSALAGQPSSNAVVLDPEVAALFPNSAAVNKALWSAAAELPELPL